MSLYPSDPSEPIVSSKGLVYKCKKDLPPEKALVVIVFGKPKVLDYVGPGLDFLEVDGYLQNHFQEEVELHKLRNGLYIWSGQVVERTSFAGDEVEYWVEGDFKKASSLQWVRHLEDDPPWDESLYFADRFVWDAVLGACEDDHTKSKHWPPDRFHREEVL